MSASEQDTRKRIVKSALEILDEVADVEKVTVRQIAERAGVGIGLINYHFRTKDNLLRIAIGDVMAEMATSLAQTGYHAESEPATRLKTMLKQLYSFGERHEKLIQFMLKDGLLNGDMQAPLFLMPVLREIFGHRKDEIELRIISLQILLPIQVTSISPSAFHFYSGIDLRNMEQRNNFIDSLVENLVK